MKKLSLLLTLLLVLLALSGCASLFTALTVEQPVSPDASMLVLEAVADDDDNGLINNNATGWAPWVEDAQGNIVPFQMVNILADAGTFYFAPNVMEGTYTLKGFRHVYTDYGLLPEGLIPSYEPFTENVYHIVQEFALDKPVVLELQAAQTESFGKYLVEYEWVGGAPGTTDDRWKANPASVKIEANPADRNMLKIVKGITNANWAPWNERNPETAY
jgi:uncharacterized protein YceK